MFFFVQIRKDSVMAKPTFFKTGPEKVAPVKNVYNGETPVYPVKDEGFKKQTEDKQAKEKTLKSLDVGKLLKTVKADRDGNLKFDEKKALKQLDNLADDISDLRNKGTDKQKDGILDKMGKASDRPGAKIANSILKLNDNVKKISDKVLGKVNIAGAATLIRNGDISSAQGVASIINTLANGDIIKIDDFTSKIAVIQGVMDDLNAYGILDAIDYVLDTMDDIDAKKRLLAKMVPGMFIGADIKGLNKAIGILGAGRMMAIYPNGIKAVVAGFKIPYGTTTADYHKLQNNLFSLFNKLDNKWNVMVRDGVEINDLTALVTMNARFYKVFRYIDHTKLTVNIYPGSGLTKEVQAARFGAAVQVARSYPQGDKERLLRSMYPRSSFLFNRR